MCFKSSVGPEEGNYEKILDDISEIESDHNLNTVRNYGDCFDILELY